MMQKKSHYLLSTHWENKGRQYLLQHPDEHIEPALLDRVWKEKSYSVQFRNHCLLLADISLSLSSLTAATKATLQFQTKTDLHGRENLMVPLPDALFSITEQNEDNLHYILDIFDELPPRMLLRRRIRQYMEYFENDEWQDTFEGAFPNIILVCPDERSKKYLFRHIQKQLDEGLELVFYLTTWELIRAQGMRAESLQEVTAEI